MYDMHMDPIDEGVADKFVDDLVSLDDLAGLWAAHERVAARLALAVARFDVTREYAADGSVTMAAWLRHHCRMSDRDAAGLVARGRFLRDHDVVASAAVSSTLSAGQVQAVRSNVTRAVEVVFAEHASELIAIIAPLDVRSSERACRVWRQHAEAVTEQPEPVVPERQIVSSRACDGSLIGRFVFDDALAAEYQQAVGTAATWEGPDDTRSTATREADAVFDVLAFYNANHTKTGTPRHRPHVEVSINADDLAATRCCGASNGEPLGFATTEAFMCDSTIQRFVTNGSVPTDIGRVTRTVPLDMFRAVAKRDGGCRHPGCNRRVAWCDAHHIKFWRHGGSTSVDNLVLLCARHHHLIHRPGWHLKLLPDGTVELTDPNGRTQTSQPPLATMRLQT
jgi:hypothetical protein